MLCSVSDPFRSLSFWTKREQRHRRPCLVVTVVKIDRNSHASFLLVSNGNLLSAKPTFCDNSTRNNWIVTSVQWVTVYLGSCPIVFENLANDLARKVLMHLWKFGSLYRLALCAYLGSRFPTACLPENQYIIRYENPKHHERVHGVQIVSADDLSMCAYS